MGHRPAMATSTSAPVSVPSDKPTSLPFAVILALADV
jgi:hypothetical protein